MYRIKSYYLRPLFIHCMLLMIGYCWLQATYANATRPQLAGVGVSATVATGYGLYAVTMRAASTPGVISSFYLYRQDGTWPKRWNEIDLEFTPGWTTVGHIVNPNHPHFLAVPSTKAPCYVKDGNNLPTAGCKISYFNKIGTGNKAGADLSFNTYNTGSIYTLPPHSNTPIYSNDQVFMPATHGTNIFNQFFTYYIYYTPNGIYWTRDLAATALSSAAPTHLPTPAFVKKDISVIQQDPNWGAKASTLGLAFAYNSKVLTPHLDNSVNTLSSTGALMNLSFNLWDGTNTDPQHIQDWGGEIYPVANVHQSTSSYQYIAFYPLTTPITQARSQSDPTQLKYGSAAIYSDFTQAKFTIHGQPVAFNELWQVSNGGAYLWPLGFMDEHNLDCNHGMLSLTLSPTALPATPSQPLPKCSWLNNN